MKRLLFSTLVLVTVTTLTAQAAMVYMKDGAQVRGTIVSATARDIQLKGPQGLQTISTDKISRIDYADTSGSAETAAPPTTLSRRVESRPPAPWRRIAEDGAAVWPAGTQQWFSLGFGVGIPLSRIDFESTGGGRSSNGDAGFQFSPQYLVKVAPQWGAGFELDYFNRAHNLTQNLLPGSETRVSGSNLLLLPILKYSFVDKGYARPYLVAGLGPQRSSTMIDAQPNPGFVWSDTSTDEPRTLVDDAHWGLASTVRLGVDFSWIGPSVFGMEFGWTHTDNDAFGPTKAGQDLGLSPVSGVQNNLAVTFRWAWRF